MSIDHNKVKHYITHATELTALSVSRLVKEKGFSKSDLLDQEESIKREKLIDQAGVDAMATALTDIPFVLEIVGSEGRKHVHQYGEALPTLDGVFGSGDYKLDMVNDVVEGSKAAKLNTSGAVSVIGAGSHKGVMPTPPDIDYLDKLFGPPQVKGKISINKSIEENLSEVVDAFKIKPSEITITMMDRDRNAHYINGAKKFGATLNLIKAGDFLPSILSFMDPSHHNKGVNMVVGIGGFEEGVMAVIAAKALGGACETRGWSPEKEIQDKYPVWSVDDVVSGDREDCFVSISSITGDDKWFDLPEVKEKDGGRQTSTLTVSSGGVNIINKIHH